MIARKYKPFFQLGKFYKSLDKSIISKKRKADACNIDLWLNGSLYPTHPKTRKKTIFQSPSKLLKFVGDEELGLLGYVKQLVSMVDGTMEVVNE